MFSLVHTDCAGGNEEYRSYRNLIFFLYRHVIDGKGSENGLRLEKIIQSSKNMKQIRISILQA